MSFAHADNATKTWISAIPKKNADGNVIEWKCEYRYTLAVPDKADYVHTFTKTIEIDTPSKAPAAYTQAELLILADKDHWDDMFHKKYAVHTATPVVETNDTSFDVSTLNAS
jgi:putative sterol carrier protein